MAKVPMTGGLSFGPSKLVLGPILPYNQSQALISSTIWHKVGLVLGVVLQGQKGLHFRKTEPFCNGPYAYTIWPWIGA